jgi:CubicO group peptidase (beta-lactamase class C family)
MNRTLILLILLSSLTSLSAQKGNRQFIGDSLDQYIRKGMHQWDIPGMQVLVINKGELTYMKAFGVLEKGKSQPVTPASLFMIGSNTKAFTGTALALLEHRGKCSLIDPVQKYIPDFRMRDDWVASHLNLTDILTHRMGMMTFQGDFIYWGSSLDRDECIAKFGNLIPSYPFRTRYGYTNLGYAIADKCIETIDGRPWATFIREEIFNPLGMQESFAHSSEMAAKKDISAAHSRVNGQIIPIPRLHNDNIGASASIWSSVQEMQHWMRMQLNKGMHNGRQVIPVEVIAKTYKPEMIYGAAGHAFNKRNFMLYGLGWFLEDYESRKIVSHTGGVDGFVSAVTLIPEEGVGIVILTNTDQNSMFSSLNREIVDACLGLPYRNYDSLMFSRASVQFAIEQATHQAWIDSVEAYPGSPDLRLAGSYTNEFYGSVKLEAREGEFIISFQHHPTLSCLLRPMSEKRYLATYSNPLYGERVFEFTEQNGEIRFVLSVNDFLEYTTYTFIKD